MSTTNPILARLNAKPVVTAVTLSFQVTPELSDKITAIAERVKAPKYNVLKLIIDQGIDDLNVALDAEDKNPTVDLTTTDPTVSPESETLPDLTETPEYQAA